MLKILKYPNKTLKYKAKKIEIISNITQMFIDGMIKSMYYHNGIGLAATQVNINKKLIIINTSNKHKNPLIVINPKIINYSKKIILSKEGCLSFPNLYLNIKRNEKITIVFLDVNKKKHMISFNNLLSICIQHEVDHINGITLFNRMSNLKKKIYIKKLL